MSSYSKKVKHPITGKKQVALFLDDYYGSHEYGVGFLPDGKDFDFEDNVDINTMRFFRVEEIK